MDKKTKIILSIVAVIVLAIVLLFVQFNDAKERRKEKDINAPKIERPVSQDKEHKECQTVGQENGSVNEEQDRVVVEENNDIEQTDASGSEPRLEDIQAIQLNIVDMKDEVKAEIKNMQAFEYAIKEFFYKAGIMAEETKCLNKITFDYQEGRVIYQMYVRSDAITYFEVVYETNTNTFSVLY